MRTKIQCVQGRDDDIRVVAQPDDPSEIAILGVEPTRQADLRLPGDRVLQTRTDEQVPIVRSQSGPVPEPVLGGYIQANEFLAAAEPYDPLRVGDVEIDPRV